MSLTELEHTVAGVVWRLGPCTGYAVRREFASSATPYWRASAGSIYPALKRLLVRGLIAAEQQPWGAEGRTLFTVTADGHRALSAWVAALADEPGPVHDPMRTRAGFLDILDAQACDDALQAAMASVERALVEAIGMEQASQTSESWADWMASKSVVHELRGRLAWLADVRAHRLPG